MRIFKNKIKVKWTEVDPMYFVRTEVYIDYYRETGSEMMRSFGYSYDRFEREGFQLPILRVESNYQKPLRYDEDIVVEATISKLKKFQIVLNYKVFNSEDVEVNNGTAIFGVISKETEEPVPMPDELMEGLRRYYVKNN